MSSAFTVILVFGLLLDEGVNGKLGLLFELDPWSNFVGMTKYGISSL